MRSTILLAACVLLIGPGTASARTWTDAKGREQTEGEMVGAAEGKAWLQTAGDLWLVPLAEMSRGDQAYVQGQLPRFRPVQAPDVPGAPAIRYQAGRQVAVLANPAVNESSGLACSRRRPGVFWTHNDSDDTARLYAVDEHGRDLGSVELAGVDAIDWEDMASLSLDGKSYLLMADTGNNGLNAAVHMIHVVEEPDVDPQRGVTVGRVPVKQTIHFSFDDEYRNCEALGVDPTSKTLLLVSKEKRLGAHVYALPWPADDPQKCFTAKRIATVPLPKVTAMDVSPDGRRAVLLTYGDAYHYVRRPEESWADAFRRPGSLIRLPPRRQGEGVCYGPDGKTLWLTSEKRPTPLMKVAPAEFGPPEDVAFTARHDGTTQRYVRLLPAGFEPGSACDLMVALHGHGSDRWQFARDPRAECRAARDVAAEHGMIYVAPDYRARTSWMGPAAEADMVQMLAELRAKYAIRRVILCGGSMGGTSALSFAALHPELIHGVAAMNPHANHVEYTGFQDAIRQSFGGTKQEKPDEYRRRSAELMSAQLRMPVAISVGDDDRVVPPASAVRLAEQLKSRGQSVLLIRRPHAGHSTGYDDARAVVEFAVDKAAR
jgi:pimeloyl-ACP methyl ester carboxylesterase